jgi:hypothetical protein
MNTKLSRPIDVARNKVANGYRNRFSVSPIPGDFQAKLSPSDTVVAACLYDHSVPEFSPQTSIQPELFFLKDLLVARWKPLAGSEHISGRTYVTGGSCVNRLEFRPMFTCIF